MYYKKHFRLFCFCVNLCKCCTHTYTFYTVLHPLNRKPFYHEQFIESVFAGANKVI